MKFSHPKIKKLIEKYKTISLLEKIQSLLEWDLEINLPPKAAKVRAEQMAFLTGQRTDLWLDSEFRSLLEYLTEHQEKLTEKERAMIRNLNHAGKYYFKVPKKIILEISKITTKAFPVWKKAKEENKFSNFLPYLKKIFELSQSVAEHLGYKENPYDALLDLYEPQLTTKDCRKIFSEIGPFLSKFLKRIKKSPKYQLESKIASPEAFYPKDTQKQLAQFLLKKMGFDFEAGRMDESVHPVTFWNARFDVRITTRYQKNDFRPSLTAAIHEGGHALYEQGINPDFEGTPLESGVSLGIHESQSRFWENQICRNPAFLEFLTPILQVLYPKELSNISTKDIILFFNQVKPSLIRTEADEVTYNLHVMLRFELEDDLINERIKPKDLPEIWRAKMRKYLGIEPKTDQEGVLQDVHWSAGLVGYFPTYTLGNLYAAQIAAKMREKLNIEKLLERGQLKPILNWLRKEIHQYGSLYWPKELIKKATGQKLNSKFFIKYIEKKYEKIYAIK